MPMLADPAFWIAFFAAAVVSTLIAFRRGG